jgi:1,4-dihydroxy-2-naphthoyl-CoA hydrolase
MTIWLHSITTDELNERGKNTMADFLDINFSEVGDNYLLATMPVNNKTKQPVGFLHGGANVVLAETIASTAANMVIDIDKQYCVGLEINANHIRSVTSGIVIGKTWPVHIGRTTQIWQIEIKDESSKLTCVSRMTAAVIDRK